MRRSILISWFMILVGSIAQAEWANPIRKVTYTGSPLVEVTPFVFGDRLYLLENNQTFWDMKPGTKPGTRFRDDEVRIRDLSSGEIVASPLKNHAFGTALVYDGRVHIFAGDFGEGKPWRQITEVSMTSSADLKQWTSPVTVIRAEGGELIYNTAVCHDPDQQRFVLLYETNDRRFPSFTFKYAASDNLVNWKKLPTAFYGKDRYVGGPALYYEAGWYYTLALSRVKGGWDTRIARSKDLIGWEDALRDRPFITFDTKKTGCPLIPPTRHECNASDVELCYYKGKTIIYFTGSDQSTCGDLQYAEFDGTPQELFEAFFATEVSSISEPF
jgi:alpha-L-fucosidase